MVLMEFCRYGNGSGCPVLDLGPAPRLRTIRTTEHLCACFHSVADNAARAMSACRCHGRDRALETVKRVWPSIDDDSKTFVVLIATSLTGRHGHSSHSKAPSSWFLGAAEKAGVAVVGWKRDRFSHSERPVYALGCQSCLSTTEFRCGFCRIVYPARTLM